MEKKLRQLAALTGIIALSFIRADAQKLLPFRLPDTGQNAKYSASKGEDADIILNPMSFTDHGDGTVTDNITGLMWQKTDGGEMAWANAAAACKRMTLGGRTDWRLPTSLELFSINSFASLNPALNTTWFTKTAADYWWTNETRADDSTKAWAVNAGGGIGAHPKSETVSSGGTKNFHVRAVRSPITTQFASARFTDLGDGTVKDNFTGLVWQKDPAASAMTWEEALQYSTTVTLGGRSEWRLPNVKELQSLNDVTVCKPSFNTLFFPNVLSGNYWSSTTLTLTPAKAWDLNVDYGIVSYNDKTLKEHVLLVRGGSDKADLAIAESAIPGGEYEMGDHFGFVDPSHPSDELPIHKVKVDSLSMARCETTNRQYLAYLNAALLAKEAEVRNDIVYAAGDTVIYCYTNKYASYYSIGYDGSVFSIVDFRAQHPMVGVMWTGAAAFCNWLSRQNGLQECYQLKTGACDFSKNGYRLPTEAEWEWAGRGGQIAPYLVYPTGNAIDVTRANLAASGDPYETGAYPLTTPVGFYDGALKLKTDYEWPGSAASYQTANGANAFGLYDMQGNVWEFVNDWYGQNYYSQSPYDNPKGPETGFLMPDGKPYRGMRGGNWYNGLVTNGVNDGHSRVANRNPTYYRGPQDPAHPWYHIGFRVARKISGSTTGVGEAQETHPSGFALHQNYPNPFNPSTTIRFELEKPACVVLTVYTALGQRIATLIDGRIAAGTHAATWDATGHASGVYFYRLQYDAGVSVKKMVLTK